MASFSYRARDPGGAPLRGVASAATVEAAIADLRGRGFLLLGIEPVAEAAARGAREIRLPPILPMTVFDVQTGMQQLAIMLHSGLTLLGSLRTAADQARRPRAARVWRNVAERIERGATLSDALEAHPRLFPSYVVQLVRVGESSGELAAMLNRAADHLEQTRNLRLMVVNAFTYPAIVLLLAIGVSAFMVLNVIPKIQTFLQSGGRELPPLTRRLLDISDWLRANLPEVGIGLATALVALWALRQWPPGRRVLDAIRLRIPVLGVVLRQAEAAAFARGMGILLESGVAMLDALRTVENLVRNRAVALRIATARAAVTRGEPLADGLSGGREFLPMLPRMVAVGEATGTLGTVLSGVATFFEAQLVLAVKRLGLVIEPVMILVVGGIVGFVYIAFFVAIFSLATQAR